MINLRQAMVNNSWIELAARWILGLTFIYASIHKILSPAEFAKIVYGYDLFPHVFINLIAIVIPFLELVAGLALIGGIYPRSAAIVIVGLLLAFMTVLTVNLVRGHEFDCGCFAVSRNENSGSAKIALVRDIIYFVLGLQIVFFDGHRRSSFGRLSSP
ncbi:MAG: MauE/DoxX family redox-associated membrane protein [Desulfobacterales bacterium]|nr:MauE/DoxX family redox-associated membrane protein [Desulfobacterales bacterium]